MNNKQQIIKIVSISILLILLGGCAATQIALTKKNLETSTKMSTSIFLDPVSDQEKTVYLQVHNTSDQDINIKSQITAQLKVNGYRIESNPKKAHYILQVNTLKVGKINPDSVNSLLSTGYGGAVSGAIAGLAIAGATNNNASGYAAGGLIGMAAGFIADSLVKDVVYAVVTDVQIIDHGQKGVTETLKQNVGQGNSGEASYKKQSAVNYIKYRTRIISTAEKMNLKFQTAKPKLETELAKSIANLFS